MANVRKAEIGGVERRRAELSVSGLHSEGKGGDPVFPSDPQYELYSSSSSYWSSGLLPPAPGEHSKQEQRREEERRGGRTDKRHKGRAR